MRGVVRFAVAALSIAACGGEIATATDGGRATGQTSWGTGGGSGTAGGSSSGGSSAVTGSLGGPMTGVNAPSASSWPGSPGIGDADAGATTGTQVADAAVLLPIRDAAVVRCNNGLQGIGGGGGNGGPETCSVFATETCSGVSYNVTCTCPQATCACQGPSSTFVPFPGCPACMNSASRFALCGFPQ